MNSCSNGHLDTQQQVVVRDGKAKLVGHVLSGSVSNNR